MNAFDDHHLGRRTFLLGSAAIAAATATTLVAPAYADKVDDALGRVTKARSGIKTLQAPFTQTRSIGLLATDVESKGKLWIVRPNRLRWDLFEPDAVTYWVGPDGLAVKNKEGVSKVSKASAGKFAAVLNDLLIMVGGDLKQLRKRYDIKVKQNSKALRLRARPKTDDVKKHIRQMTMKTESNLWAVKRIIIEEHSGDQSVIRFGTSIKNAKIDPKRMRPPKS